MHGEGRLAAELPTKGLPTESLPTESLPARSRATDHAVRPASTEEAPSLERALTEAFMDDPIFSWLMPTERTRALRLRRFFAIELRHLVLPRGTAWTSGELAGAALVLPPKAWSTPPHVALLQGRCFGMQLHRAAGLLAQIERLHLREAHYYFAYIGVAPGAQGQGLGSGLMGPTLERCDEQRVPAYLEASSERNAALYERLGFRLIREVSFASSPPLRLMRRPPARI
jgi:ribosomal protein S18 acetylase RimI-like enzyme